MSEIERARAELARRQAAAQGSGVSVQFGGGNVDALQRAREEAARRGIAPKRGIVRRAGEFLFGDDDPTTQNTGERIGSALNKAGEALTFGLVGDEASAAVESVLPGVNYEDRRDHYRQQEEVLERDSPALALGAEIGGSVAGMALPFGTAGTLARGARLGPRVGMSIATGAAGGGTYGFMEGEGFEDRADGLKAGGAIGVGAGLVAVPVGAGVQKIADHFVRRGPLNRALQSAQSAAEQRAGSRAAYQAFDDAGAEVTLPAFRRMSEAAEQAMRGVEPSPNMVGPLGRPSKAYDKITRTLAGTGDAVDEAIAATGDASAQGSIRMGAIEDIRREIGREAGKVTNLGRPTRGAVSAMRAKDAIDTFVDSLGPEDIAAGDKDAAISALKKAREVWQRSVKTQAVENAIDQSENYLGGRESGLRNQIGSLLRQNKKTKMFTPEEEAALRKVLGNSMAGRAIRAVGDGLGRKAAMFTGGALGGLDGAAIGAATAEAAGRVGESSALRNAEIARSLISSGSLQNLPVASEATRRIAEALMRRTAAVAPH